MGATGGPARGMSLPPLYVIRHGQTVWNREGRHQGRMDSPLTDKGREQASAMGTLLAGLGLRDFDFLASPQGRAWDTANIVGDALERRPVAHPDLVEVAFGAWEGLTKEDIFARWPDAADIQDPFHWHFTAPGGERLEDMVERVDRVLAACTRTSVLVCHGITSRVLRGRALGHSADEMAALPGGQGVIHAVIDGKHHSFEPR